MTTQPEAGDSDHDLLYKWCLALSQARANAANAPKLDDSKNDLLRKILALLHL